MTRRYTILQKKLHQLQTELTQVFALPVDQTCYHQLLSDGIEQRLEFLKNLLTAEMTSHSSKQPPHHLLHVERRLDELEAAFRQWEDYRNSVHASNVDNASVCSCTESGLNDDGESFSSQNMDGTEFGSSGVFELRVPEGFYGGSVVGCGGGKEEAPLPEEKVVVIERDKGFVWRWKYCVKMVFYLFLGVFLIVTFLSSFGYSDHQGSFTPT